MLKKEYSEFSGVFKSNSLSELDKNLRKLGFKRTYLGFCGVKWQGFIGWRDVLFHAYPPTCQSGVLTVQSSIRSLENKFQTHKFFETFSVKDDRKEYFGVKYLSDLDNLDLLKVNN